MSRIDKKAKPTASLTPTAEELAKKPQPAIDPVTVEEQAPIQSAASYAKRVQQRKAMTAAAKAKKTPVGGAPPIEPGKLAKLTGMVQPDFGEEEMPEELRDDTPPARESEREPPIPGVGAAYSVNQKIARGDFKDPVSIKEAKEMEEQEMPRRERKPLSEETIRAMEMAQQTAEENPVEEDDTSYEEDDTGVRVKGSEQSMLPERDLDLNFNELARRRNDLATPERRKKIEDRLTPMQIEDMITNREIKQTIPVVEGKLSYTLRTFNQQENLFCLQYVFDHPGSTAYAEELLNFAKLVCSVVAINGGALPDHRSDINKSTERVDKDLFEKKLSHLSRMPAQLLADLSLQAIWFSDRVNSLFSLDELKNG